MDEEATRLSHDPRKQKAASQPLDSVGVAGPLEVQEVDEREHRQHPAWACPARKNCSRNCPSWPRPVRNPSKAQPPYSTPIKDTTETAGSTRVGCILRYLLSDPLLELLGGHPFALRL